MLLNHLFALFRPFLLSAASTIGLAANSLAGHAQVLTLAPPAPRLLAGTYRYTAYAVFDTESPNEPTVVRGVGGTLTLRPDSTYAKRFSITLGTRTVPFIQDGRYLVAGDSIRFAFHDQKGPDVQRGTAYLDSAGRHLTVTIIGYPAGNRGVYELEAVPAKATGAPPPVAIPAPPPRGKADKKRRH